MIKLKRRIYSLLIIAFIIIGIISSLFPVICTFVSELNTTRAVINYEERSRFEEKYKNILIKNETEKINNKIEEISKSICKKIIPLNPKKEQQKEYKNGDMLGYITIPSIHSILPVYEGKDYKTLQKGIGHIPIDNKKTQLPFLGKNKHCVLAGHSGLTTKRLFSDLHKVKVGDVFYIKVKNFTYKYKVIEISIKKPKEAEKYLQIEKNKDYCTLVTCTPVPTNTHRLLVKGERIKYAGKKINIHTLKKFQQNQSLISFKIACGIMTLLILIKIYIRRKTRRIKK